MKLAVIWIVLSYIALIVMFGWLGLAGAVLHIGLLAACKW